MAPKSGQKMSKKGREEVKKQEKETAEKKRKEDESWKDEDVKGGKSKQEDKEEKRKADLARKAETARLLAEEEAAAEAAASKGRPAARKKITKPIPEPTVEGPVTESYAATGIDNALDLLEVVTAKMDKASVGQQAADIESHPERRFKAAYEAYQQRELPNIKQERPGLRLQQYKDLLHKQFEKSPENPFNQTTVAYDAKKEDKVQALQKKKAEVEERLREK